MVRLISLILGLIISQPLFALTNVSATVDKNPVIANESFVLTVIADDDVDTNALDTSALQKDFIVGRTSVSSQTSMINFQTTRSTKWTTVLIARTPGNYQIPALSVDGVKTQPINLSVIAADDSRASTQQDLFITSDISAKEVYVQQQLTLTVKLHFATELKRGSLSEPELTGANITQVGKDKESETIINGRRFRVIERTYAISPQQSGDFILKSPIFSGEIMVPSTRRNSFLSFAETKPVSVIGDEIQITVSPIPANYQGTWLPSELLSLHQEWQPAQSSFKVGEPITRVITLTAAGLSEEQLPEIDMPMPDGVKVYPDQAELHTGMNNNRLVSQKVKNFAIVANKPGTYQLPEISIPWWNTVANKLQYATLPAQTIEVLPNGEQSVVDLPPQAQQQSPDIAPPETIVIQQASLLQWVFLALWLLTLLAWFISARRNLAAKVKTQKPINDHYLALLACCKTHDSAKALLHLVPWFNQLTGANVSTLSQLLKHCNNDALVAAITDLQQAKYGQNTQNWQGKSLLKAVEQYHKKPQYQPIIHGEFSLNPQ